MSNAKDKALKKKAKTYRGVFEGSEGLPSPFKGMTNKQITQHANKYAKHGVILRSKEEEK